MKSILSSCGKLNFEIKNEKLKEMAKVMVRKDFELLRIQNLLSQALGSVELYSHCGDELSSIDQIIELVFKKGSIQLYGPLYKVLTDGSLKLAFDYKVEGVGEIKKIKNNAEILVDLIFEAGEYGNTSQAASVLLEGFEKFFPHLEID